MISEESQPSRSLPRCTLPRLIPTPSHLHMLTPSSLVSQARLSFKHSPTPQPIGSPYVCLFFYYLTVFVLLLLVIIKYLVDWVVLTCVCCPSCVMGLEALARYERRCKNLQFGAGDQPPRVTTMIIASDSHATQCARAGRGEYAGAFLNLSGTKEKKEGVVKISLVVLDF